MRTRYIHFRLKELVNPHSFNPHLRISAKGGYTVAYFVDLGEIKFALSTCSPEDRYCKRIGRDVAEGRLNAGKFEAIPYEGYDSGKSAPEAIATFLFGEYNR